MSNEFSQQTPSTPKYPMRISKESKHASIQSEVCCCVSKTAQTSYVSPVGSGFISSGGGDEEDVPKSDPINTEFLYYSATLKEIAPKLSEESDRQRIIPWIKKMFRPEYHSSILREKRNRYLLFMTLSLLNDETYSILRTRPPSGAVPDLNSLAEEDIQKAEWETDDAWRQTLKHIPHDHRNMPCACHKDIRECNLDHHLDNILDEEYTFLLYLARPYAYLLKTPGDRNKINAWLETLCKIHGTSCSTMRGIRNDYMMALLGYLQELRVTGPFLEFPNNSRALPPLTESAKLSPCQTPALDVTCTDVNDFMATQPLPEEGAFCYIGVTGDIIYQDCGRIVTAEVLHDQSELL